MSYSRRSGTGPLLSVGCGQTQTDRWSPGSALGFPQSLGFSLFMRAKHATSGSLQGEQGTEAFSSPGDTDMKNVDKNLGLLNDRAVLFLPHQLACYDSLH